MTSNFYERVTNGYPPYIIAEIGANHNGDMILAKKIIDAASECGCDAVKFQSWTPESLVAREEYDRNIKYNDSFHKHFGSLRKMIERYYLREEQHYEMKAYCLQMNIEFCSTPFSCAEVDLLKKVNVPFMKVASMDVNNPELLRCIARANKPVILSTGMATLAEIDSAVKVIENENNNEIILLHCISVYPPDYYEINLRNIPMLRQTLGYPVGFSDHTIGISIPLAAVAMGSCIIEKHFTIDKSLPGWDHAISADTEEMKVIVREAKNIHRALGNYRRNISEAEQLKKLKFRRSLVATRQLSPGYRLQEADVAAKRPGTGIHPDEIKYVVGRRLKRSLDVDAQILWEDLE